VVGSCSSSLPFAAASSESLQHSMSALGYAIVHKEACQGLCCLLWRCW
jgi:hypothetical protein